ncbi:MAG TPA: tail fiber protein [Actinomycetota bacterium]
MSEPFVAEIRMFGFNFAPTGWALCNGQLMPISQNTALFSLLGTSYGGDGKSTFALPDLQGSVPIHAGQGQGLSEYFLGQESGVESVTLITTEMPLHTHTASAHAFDPGDVFAPGPTVVPATADGGFAYNQTANANLTQFSPQALSIAGGSLPHNNMMPYLTLNFCIALQGVFPPRG